MDIDKLIKEINKYPISYGTLKVIYIILNKNKKVSEKYKISDYNEKEEIILIDKDNDKIKYIIKYHFFGEADDVDIIKVVDKEKLIIHIDFMFNTTEIIKENNKIKLDRRSKNNKGIIYINKFLTDIFLCIIKKKKIIIIRK